MLSLTKNAENYFYVDADGIAVVKPEMLFHMGEYVTTSCSRNTNSRHIGDMDTTVRFKKTYAVTPAILKKVGNCTTKSYDSGVFEFYDKDSNELLHTCERIVESYSDGCSKAWAIAKKLDSNIEKEIA